jgi:hypothetical protein
VSEKTFTVTLEQDGEELVLPLPTEILNQMGWDIGDVLEWSDNFDGTFSITKKDDDD